jgi:hypothetical protein
LKEQEKIALKAKLAAIHGQLASVHSHAGMPIMGHTAQGLAVTVVAPGLTPAFNALINTVEELSKILEHVIDIS